MAFGFYHPTRGYWQTDDAPAPEFRAAYPAGTVEIPVKPGSNYEWDGTAWVYVAPPPTDADVNAERDRRIAAGFTFMGHLFQADPESLQNVNGAVSAALAAQLGGIAPDEANWFNGGPFSWLAADNASVQMTPGEVVAFGMAAAAHKNAHIHAARMLKNADPIPADFADDTHWP